MKYASLIKQTVVSERLGHTDVKMTADVYIHINQKALIGLMNT